MERKRGGVGLGLDRGLLGLGEVGPVWVEVQEAGGDGLGLERPAGYALSPSPLFIFNQRTNKENKKKEGVRERS